MVPEHCLLILSCSRRKRPEPDLLPAIERYDGPAFRVLRRFLRERPEQARELDIFVLSAAYGLIPAQQPIPNYDLVMTSQRATELRSKVVAAFSGLLAGENYSDIGLVMSRWYLAALEGWHAVVPQEVNVTLINGLPGVQSAKLKHWLWRNAQEDESTQNPLPQNPLPQNPLPQSVSKPRGYARIRGVEVTMTPAQVLEIARYALAEKNASHRYYSWYVQVDDQRVSPKWLVSQLTGLPASAFVTDEAKRFLRQLGIQVMHV